MLNYGESLVLSVIFMTANTNEILNYSSTLAVLYVKDFRFLVNKLKKISKCYNVTTIIQGIHTMKLSHLRQITDYLQKFRHINAIHRVADSVIKIVFSGEEILYFNMQKGNAYISKCRREVRRSKVYQAPFDVILSKRFNRSNITSVLLYNDDKIIRITTSLSGAYKAHETILQFEFTGKTTNVIILDSDEIVQEALRHVDAQSSYRVVKVGVELLAPPPLPFTPKEFPLEDVEAFLYETCDREEKQRLAQVKKQKISLLQKKIIKLERNYEKLEDETALGEETTKMQHIGNLVLSNMHQIKPYVKILELNDYDGSMLTVEIPSNLPSASAISNYFFKRAKKMKQKAKNLHIERDSLQEKIEHQRHFMDAVESAADVSQIQMLFPPRKQQKKVKLNESYEIFWIEGYKVLLGKNERGNIELLEKARARDIWLHLKGRPSTHVIITTDKQKVPESVLYAAAKLCVDFSVFGKGHYEVDYTPRREIRIQEGANVLYNNYQTLSVEKE